MVIQTQTVRRNGLPSDWQLKCLTEEDPPSQRWNISNRSYRKVISPHYATDHVGRMLEGCTGQQKLAYLGRYLAGMSWRELGNALGLSHVQARRIYFAALRRADAFLPAAQNVTPTVR